MHCLYSLENLCYFCSLEHKHTCTRSVALILTHSLSCSFCFLISGLNILPFMPLYNSKGFSSFLTLWLSFFCDLSIWSLMLSTFYIVSEWHFLLCSEGIFCFHFAIKNENVYKRNTKLSNSIFLNDIRKNSLILIRQVRTADQIDEQWLECHERCCFFNLHYIFGRFGLSHFRLEHAKAISCLAVEIDVRVFRVSQ